MVRKKETAKDKSPAAANAPIEEEIGTLTQTRTRRAPKPNPKYINDNIISTPKALSTSSESPAVSDTDEVRSRVIKTTTKKVVTAKKEIASVNPSETSATPSTESRTLRQRGATTGKESVPPKIRGRPGPKKQKLDFDDSDVGFDETIPEEEFKDELKKDSKTIRVLKTPKTATKPAAIPVKRSTRATENKSEGVFAKTDGILDLGSLECKEVVQDSEDIETSSTPVGKSSSFVTIVNVTDIIQNKAHQSTEVATRKRTSEDTDSADSGKIKKKYREEKPSLISERKSYLPKHNQSGNVVMLNETEGKSPVSLPMKPKIQLSPAESPEKLIGKRRALQQTLIDSKEKVKLLRERASLKQQPVQRKQSPVVRKQAILIAPAENSSGVKLFTPPSAQNVRTVNNGKLTSSINNRSTSNPINKVMVGKALPQRILNSSLTPIAKQHEQVKLLNTENSFSIDLTADEENNLSPGKKLNKLQDLKGLKNSSNMINKTATMTNRESLPQDPKDRLSKSLNASLNLFREQAKNQQKKPSPQSVTIVKKLETKPGGPVVQRKITRFESWFIIDVPKIEIIPQKHLHSFSLMELGNNIKEIELPPNWDYKIILQRRQLNSSFDSKDVFTGELQEAHHHQIKESEKRHYEPSNIMFKRTIKQNSRTIIDRSLFFKTDLYAITIDGKKSVLVGAPDNITSIDDIQALLEILHSVNFKHSCVEGLSSETHLL